MRQITTEAGAEVLKFVRAPEFMLPTLLLPVAFYALFALAIPSGGGAPSYLLATYGVFAVLGPSIFGFGISVAQERKMGWLALRRSGPAPAGGYILAKAVTTLIFCVAALATIYLAASFGGGVALARTSWMVLLGVHLASAIPAVLIGVILGFTLSPNGAVAFANLAFLALSALGGLWIPITILPSALQAFAQYLPTYHAGQIALAVVGKAPFDPANLAALTLMTALLAVLALTVSRRS